MNLSESNDFFFHPISDNDLRFVLTCAQIERSDDDTLFLTDFLLHDLPGDLDALVDLAGRHALIPPMHRRLKQLAEEGVIAPTHPLPILVNDVFMTVARRNMLMTAELFRVQSLLQQADVDFLAFKGPALAQRFYGGSTLRQYSDLDLLIRPEAFGAAVERLEAEGYVKAMELSPVQAGYWYRRSKDIILFHADKRIHLELHWRFLDEDYPLALPTDSAWDARTQTRIDGRSVPTFGSEPLLVYLCVHGAKHLWERLGWVMDLDRIVRSGSLNWQRLEPSLDDPALAPMLLLGLALAERLFRTPLPASVRERLQSHAMIEPILRFVLEGWKRPHGMLSQTRVMLRLFPTTGMKLRYLRKLIFKPSSIEYAMLDLPRGLYWLYYAIRPFLLAKKYLLPHRGVPERR